MQLKPVVAGSRLVFSITTGSWKSWPSISGMVSPNYFIPIKFGVIIKFKISKTKLIKSWKHTFDFDEELKKLKRIL